MELISFAIQDKVAIARLRHGVTNAINERLVSELGDLLSQAARDDQVHSLVLTSANTKFFSIGFDIPGLIDLPKHDFKAFYQAFNRLCLALYAWPKPTLAALPGHAIAGGCILALCCDYRLIASGRRLMGLNEIRLGVPVPYPADRILREIVGSHRASLIMESGAFYPPEEAAALGLVDQIAPIEALERIAIEKIRDIGNLSLPAFAAIKQNRVEPVISHLSQVLEAKEENFIEHWYAPEARGHLAEASKKF